jgi:FkbM family methyltransferase
MIAIFDVGANDGTQGFGYALQYPQMTVYAFEPTPELVEKIIIGLQTIEKQNNRRLNNYRIVQKAVSDFDGSATFNVAGQKDWGCSSLHEFETGLEKKWSGRTDLKVTHQIEVEVTRLDTFCESEGITHIAMLHCDTQGSDMAVMRGLGNFRSCLERGQIEVAISKTTALYKNQHYLKDSVIELASWGFEIVRIIADTKFPNEIDLLFQNESLKQNLSPTMLRWLSLKEHLIAGNSWTSLLINQLYIMVG